MKVHLCLLLMRHVRYNALKRANPEKAEVLFGMAEEQAKERMEYLQKLVKLYGAE